MNKGFKKAVSILKRGGVVIFPTDTAFGVGVRIDDEKAVERLFRLRKRPKDKAVLVLVSSFRMIREYVEPFDLDVKALMKKHWPGGLTIVLKCKKNKVPSVVRAGGDTIGIRIPKNETTRNLVRKIGVPILAPSANFSGEKTPFKHGEINNEFRKVVDYTMNGKCLLKTQSTIIDVSVKPWKVIREGAVKIKT